MSGLLLELYAATGAVFGLVVHFRVTIRTHNLFWFRIHNQATPGAFGGPFRNRRRTRGANALRFLARILERRRMLGRSTKPVDAIDLARCSFVGGCYV
jgi:hypothetical protein